MEWQQLEYFRTVARLEHFTRAAECLSVSQPALSRSIARLEEELGVPLFERVGRSVRLTRYGQLFLKRVERAMREIAEARREIEELQDPDRGEVRLGFLPTLGIHLVPELIGAFHRRYPKVTFYLVQHAADRIFQQMEAGEIDLCLLSPPVRRPGIGWVDLKTEELFVIVRPDHPLAARDRVDLRELAGEPFISLKRGYGMRTITEA
ncbi:MAG: LysR family transcriptional regulator, partial [Alicyclobacillaceae bacterium]|nr:LysR family transcriptional regulator [Alicyclobacillaceae bacterium]